MDPQHSDAYDDDTRTKRPNPYSLSQYEHPISEDATRVKRQKLNDYTVPQNENLTHLLDTLNWRIDETLTPKGSLSDIHIRDKGNNKTYIEMFVPPKQPKTLYVFKFFLDKQPTLQEIPMGRTRSGIGMELIVLYAKKKGFTHIELEDAWEDESGAISSFGLQNLTSDKYKRRGIQYGFKDEELNKFEERTKNEGFYGAWGFENSADKNAEPFIKILNVENFIRTNQSFV